jgi:hypothetical protein
MALMPKKLPLIVFHVQDTDGRPLSGVLASSTGGPGPWTAAPSNACGDIFTELTPATDYVITFSKPGYTSMTIPADLKDCGIVTQALERESSSGGGEPGVLPPVPTRAQVCAVQHSLAGLTYHTTEHGDIPAWFYGALNDEDRAEARACHRAAGDTHIPCPVTEAYRQEGTLWPPALREGYDHTQDMDAYRALAMEIICDGFFIDCALGGDGLGTGPDYNDPVGRTYGHGWLMDNLARLLRALEGDGTPERPDLTPYICFRPGWDGVFYGWGGVETAQMTYDRPLRWRFRDGRPDQFTAQELDDQQTRMKNFGELFRRLLPDGYLAIEHTPGNIPIGLGPGDWSPHGGPMSTYDTVMSEYATVHEDSYWQVVARCIDTYHRPADQPAHDDPNPPKYLAQGSPRGPYFYVAFEPTTAGVYEWCRGRCTLEQIKEQDAYMRSTGVTLTGYPVRW